MIHDEPIWARGLTEAIPVIENFDTGRMARDGNADRLAVLMLSGDVDPTGEQRQALQAGINRKEILDTVYTPDWKLATS